MMDLGFMTVCTSVVVAAVLAKRVGDRRELERHAITPEALHALLAWNRDVLVVDVRQPLDLLGNSVIIPGAKWFVPRAVLDDPSLIGNFSWFWDCQRKLFPHRRARRTIEHFQSSKAILGRGATRREDCQSSGSGPLVSSPHGKPSPGDITEPSKPMPRSKCAGLG